MVQPPSKMSPPKKKLKQSSVTSYFLTSDTIHHQEEEVFCLKYDSRPNENCETVANIHDIGHYVGQQNEIEAETKHKLLMNPWTPTDNFK